MANLNSLCFDYVTRQKLQGTNLSWYIVEQLPVIGARRLRPEVRRHDGPRPGPPPRPAPHLHRPRHGALRPRPRLRRPPFPWDEEQRRHLRARLDALYFHLYGLSRADASYILDTFPIVRRQDKAAFGHYRTKEMILAYMNALAAGDTGAVVAV